MDENPNVLLAVGGRIPEIDANRDLLARIEKTPPLNADELLDLAIFFQGFPTNASLSQHIALVAAAKAVDILEDEGNSRDGGDTGNSGDTPKLLVANNDNTPEWEDRLFGYDNTGEEEWERRNARITFAVFRNAEDDFTLANTHLANEIKSVPAIYPGINLLVEIDQNKAAYIIGISPMLAANVSQ